MGNLAGELTPNLLTSMVLGICVEKSNGQLFWVLKAAK